MGIIIAYPWIAFLPAASLFWAAQRWGAKSAFVAAASWALYGVYEYLMKARVLCSGECNIRVDLLLFYPVLLIMICLACLNSWRNSRREPASRP